MASDNLFDAVNRICDSVDKAIENNDFSNFRHVSITQETKTSTTQKANVVRKPQNGHMDEHGNAFHGTYTPSSSTKRPPKVKDAYFRPADTDGATTMYAFGLFGAIILGVAALSTFLVNVVFHLGWITTIVGYCFMTLTFFAMVIFFLGVRNLSRIDRYRRYCEILEEQKFALIADLAFAVGKKENVVKEDLRYLIKKGYFRQAHFDKNEKNFFIADEVYALYRATEEKAEKEQKEQEVQQSKQQSLPVEVQNLLNTGESYVQHIRDVNREISDKDIAKKLDRLTNIVTKILEVVREDATQARKLNMFMEYYLPTTVKLVDAYFEMDKQETQGDNILKAQDEIRVSLDTINEAYEKLLDSFFADTAMDVSTDINVMQTMLKQDGLANDDLTIPSMKDTEDIFAPLQESYADDMGGMALQASGG